MSTLITTLGSIVQFITGAISEVVGVITADGNEIILFSVGLSLVGVVVHWFKMIFRA